MPKTFIATLGFDQSSLVRLIGEKGLSPSDAIYLITSVVTHPRTENAIRSIVEFVNTVNPKVEVKVVRLKETDLEVNVVRLFKLIKGCEEPVIDITGGPKGLSFSLFLAACFAGVSKVYMTTETLGERVEVPTLAMPTYTLTARQRDVLSLLPCRVTELSRKLKISKSTASRLLRNLVKKGLAYRSGGGKVFEPTLTGRILLKMLTEVRGSVNTHSTDF
jgi:CRISPR locus-related DNA-binding protein